MQRLLLFVLLGLLPLNAAADGKVFPRSAIIAETFIPDQHALICWSNGMERLVIETRFVGEGTNFAWVVPLPGVPEIEPATSGLFATLAYQLRPELIHTPTPWGALFLGCIALGWLAINIRQSQRFGLQTLLGCLLAGTSLFLFSPFAALVVTLVLIWGVERIIRGTGSLLEILAVLMIFAFLGAMLLPALGPAGIRGTPTGVTELASVRVGAFETKTIAAKTSGALLDWLRENDFSISTNAAPVVADYVKRGWVFVSSKLARDQASVETNSIHPLSFTFRTEQPVYPMRLTGVDAGPLEVELYVFGPARAEAEHFSVATCVPAFYPRESQWKNQLSAEVAIMHPLMRGWAVNSPVVTKLKAKLTPAQMRDDVVLRWTEFAPQRTVVYSRRAAGILAANWGIGLVLGVFTLTFVIAAIVRGRRSLLSRLRLIGLGIGLVVMVGVYALLPKVTVQTGRFRPSSTTHNLQGLGKKVVAKWKSSPPQTSMEARRAVVFEAGVRTNNFLLGGAIREEDSPGNYVIRQTTNSFEFFWYDGNGAEQSLR